MVSFYGVKSQVVKTTFGAPEDSVLGSLLFCLYAANIVNIAVGLYIKVRCYADDLQQYICCPTYMDNLTVQRIIDCIQSIDKWMPSNRLKLNHCKTQFAWFGTRQQLDKIKLWSMILSDSTSIVISRVNRDLGVTIDSQLSMESHVNVVLRSCFYQLRQQCSVRSSLTI